MRKRKATIAIHAFLILCALITLVPFGWMLLTSLKTYAESIQIPMVVFPELPQWSNYAKVWNHLSDPETVCEHLYCHDPVNRQP